MKPSNKFDKLLNQISNIEDIYGAAILDDAGNIITYTIKNHSIITSEGKLFFKTISQPIKKSSFKFEGVFPEFVIIEDSDKKTIIVYSNKLNSFIILVGNKNLKPGILMFILDETVTDYVEELY